MLKLLLLASVWRNMPQGMGRRQNSLPPCKV